MIGVIYARYSAGPNQTDQSIEGQLRDCNTFAVNNEITIINTYVDKAISGKDFENRVALNEMLSDATKGLFDCIIVWKIDRFGRDRYEIAVNKNKLKKLGVKLMYAKEHIPDGPEGIILESLLEGMAEYYSAELSQKLNRGLREAALKGNVYISKGMIGYYKKDKKVYIDEKTAPIIKEIFTRYIGGETTGKIADDLNSRGFLTSQGNKMASKSILYILRNEKYMGIYNFRGEIIDGAIPAIVDKEVFMEANRKLEGKIKRNAVTKAKSVYLLTGKCICSECNGPMVGESGKSHTGKEYNYYKCMNKKKKKTKCSLAPFSRTLLENAIMEYTFEYVLQDDIIEKISDKVVEISKVDESEDIIKRLLKSIRTCENGIKNMLNAIEQGIITTSTKERLNDLENEKIELESELAMAKIKKPTITKEQVVYWLNLFRDGDIKDIIFQNKMVDTFIQSIVLSKEDITIYYNFQNGKVRIPTSSLGSDTDCLVE